MNSLEKLEKSIQKNLGGGFRETKKSPVTSRVFVTSWVSEYAEAFRMVPARQGIGLYQFSIHN
jgi:hypothetical protein